MRCCVLVELRDVMSSSEERSTRSPSPITIMMMIDTRTRAAYATFL